VKRLAAILVLLAAGCSRTVETPMHMDIQCECFATAAYEIFRANTLASLVEPPEPVQKCCGNCGKNGLPKGKVLSGDKQKVVACPCPETCPCKSPSGCITGACKK
jgi:hypothetical protein